MPAQEEVHMPDVVDVVVVGGGIIGATIAGRLLGRWLQGTLVEPAPGGRPQAGARNALVPVNARPAGVHSGRCARLFVFEGRKG